MSLLTLEQLLGGPFATVLDVGGNIGEFAQTAADLWPEARVVSFEPVPVLAKLNRKRAAGRWETVQAACSDRSGRAEIAFCANQHTASSLQTAGTVRREQFRIRDRHVAVEVELAPLDDVAGPLPRPLLLKVDVEGHEAAVLAGSARVLGLAATVLCEVQNDPQVFLGAARPWEIDETLRSHGLRFCGLAGALLGPKGRPLQFDGIWRRHP